MSAMARVEGRWATTRVVVSRSSRPSPARMIPSVVGSTAEVASSSRSRRGRRTRARASATRWRWPPERVAPRSPTTDWRPSGSRDDEPPGAGQPQRGLEGAVGHVGAEEHVLLDRRPEQERLLEGDGAGRAQLARARGRSRRGRPARCGPRPARAGGRGRARASTSPNRSGRRRRPSSPAGTWKRTSSRTGLPGSKAKPRPSTSRSSGPGGQAAPAAGGGRDGLGQHTGDPVVAGDGPGQLAEDVADHPQGPADEGEQADEGHDRAHRDLAAVDPPGADQDQGHDPEVRQRLQGGVEDGPPPGHVDLGARATGRRWRRSAGSRPPPPRAS